MGITFTGRIYLNYMKNKCPLCKPTNTDFHFKLVNLCKKCYMYMRKQ